ncbi:uncharacterized protein [Cicer arietinum]|uniref:Uncharacterized protein LOC101501348 n=1 Tax=Cicer arietinum TaxID=3827 RepID=A0A1S2XPE2_CICAR|nr:uncharacterized protein LOC101501348 [Cicer arietinum]
MWKYLPNEILEEIMKRLPLREYLAMRAICFPWWISVSNAIAKDYCRPLPELPLIVLQNEDSMFYSLSTESLHRPKRQLLDHDQFCFGSVEGWLIVCDYTLKAFVKFFFLNPVTNVRIMIPSKLYIPFRYRVRGDLYVEKMVASFEPSSKFYLAALLTDHCHFAIFKPLHKSWTIIKPDRDPRTVIVDMEIIGSKLYVAIEKTPQSIVLVYDLNDTSNGPPKAEELLVTLPLFTSTGLSILPNSTCFVVRYLGKDEASKELYLISMTYSGEPHEIIRMEVFKLDMNKEPIAWQYVRLDDRVAFVSSCKSVVISRDELNYNKELISGNSIYFGFTFFCHLNPWLGLKLGKFCLTDSSIKYFPVKPSKDCGAPFPIWFVPSLW